MAIEQVKAYFHTFGRDTDILEFPVSSATVELAAQAAGVEPARIAKTLSFYAPDPSDGEAPSALLIVTAGDQKIDNSKFKHVFGKKAKMLAGEDVKRLTGHAIGGVCPFANPPRTAVYLDQSLRRFSTVFPAAGSSNSAIELTCEELEYFSNAVSWVDVCKPIA